MATREIKTRFKLEGEQEFKRAMSDAANATKVLDSEMKLAKAQFEQTGDAEAYAAEQTRILKEKIEEQKGAVAAAERAMASLAANGVSKNDKTYQMWATRLNNAKTTLTGLETQLGKAETGFEDVNTAADNTDSKLDSIDKELRFQNTLKILENVRDRFNQIIRGAARAGKAVWDMETDAGKWADDLATAASQAGIDVETYQSWQYASRFIDTSVGDISKSVRKMEADLKASTDDALKTFNQLGVATRNADGSVRDATDVFFDTIDALGRVEDATQRGIYAQTLLGSHYNTLNPLIEAGSQAYKDMAEEGMRVAVVDEEQVKKLGELNDAQEKMDAVLTKTKETLLGEIAPAFTTITDGITTAAEAFNEFLESEEGRTAMAELNEALSGVIDSFLGEDNGKGTFQAIVEGATEAVNAFTGAMTWITKNKDTVKDALFGIAGVWAGLNVAPPVLMALHLMSRINWSGLSGGSGAAAKAAQSAAGAAASGSTGGGIFSTIGAAIAKAIPAAVGAYVALKPAETDEQWDSYYYEGQRTEAGKALDLPKLETDYWTMPDAERRALENANLWDPSQGASKEPANVGGIDGIMEEIASRFGEFIRSHEAQSVPKDAMGVPLAELEAANEQFAQLPEEATEKGQEAAQNLADAFTEGAPQAVDAVTETTEEIKTTTEQGLSDMETLGYNAAIGLANGINIGAVEAIGAANDLARQVYNSIQSALDIHSPSRVLMRMGQFTAEGFAEGIEDGMARVEAATARMGRAAMAEPTYRSGGSWGADPAAGQGSQQSSGGGMNATILMDKTVVGRLVAPIVNEAIGAQVAASRR